MQYILECNTTSQLYGIGKATSLKKIQIKQTFSRGRKSFCNRVSKPQGYLCCREQALVYAYNEMTGESINALRYKHFFEKVATNTVCIHPQTLPSTSVAANCHGILVYLQILEWKGCSAEM